MSFAIQTTGNYTIVRHEEPVPSYPINTGRTEMATEYYLDEFNFFTPTVPDSVIHPAGYTQK